MPYWYFVLYFFFYYTLPEAYPRRLTAWRCELTIIRRASTRFAADLCISGGPHAGWGNEEAKGRT